MKAHYLCPCLLGLLCTAILAGPLRVMPVGDSITVGIGDGTNGGYRGPLQQALVAGGYTVEWVGTQVGGTIPDPDHEGHSGWRADQVRDNMLGWLALNPPDIILLHIGTNDITQGEHAAGITAEIGQILSIIDAYESSYHATITVVLARIINRSTPLSALGVETTALNASIASMASARISAGDRLVVVDQESALSYPADLADAVHPNASGYGKMSGVWLAALTPLLRNRGEFISDTIPFSMVPGSSYDCRVTMRNSGHQPWQCSPSNTLLNVAQVAGPAAYQLIPAAGLQIPISPCQIDVGQNCTFAFTVAVPPNTPMGSYEIAWQMKDNDEWFDSNGHNAVFRKAVAVRLYPLYRGDFDDDGDVDQYDFGSLQVCLSGSGMPQNDPACSHARLDGDADVDQDDVTAFRACMSGPNARPGSACAK